MHMKRSRASAAVLAVVLLGLCLPLASTEITGAASAAGAATTCKPAPLKKSLKAADAVFIGQVTKTKRHGNMFASRVALAWVYKGSTVSDTVAVMTRRGSCALGRLEVGERYIFVLSEHRGRWVATGDTGTTKLTGKSRHAVKEVLGAGAAIGGQTTAPIDVRLTKVGHDSDASFLYAAAPGLAVVILALLGWVVVRRLGTA
jgi:hypothetical protein